MATSLYIQLTSPMLSDPANVTFPRSILNLDEVVNEKQRASVINSTLNESSSQGDTNNDFYDLSIFDLHSFQRRIVSMKTLLTHTKSNTPYH